MKSEDKYKKPITIIVNTREKTVTDKVLTAEAIIGLAFDDPPTGPNVCFSINYRRGAGKKAEGMLTEGEEVRVKQGMIFNVTATDKS